MNDIMTNMPEPVSVSELSQKLKRTLESEFEFVRVRGELSKVKIHTSGHLYTDLKDQNSVINSVCWRGTVSRLAVRPEEGLEVICTGKITTYPARSNYQLVIETMELAGQGALLKMLEDRKRKLAEEGLFDPARKKALPFIPRRIGIITSQTGAVIQDILHRLQDRFPLPVLLWPATVQGPNTVPEVVAGLQAFNALPVDQRPDVLIVARGGGSLEDLMPFNEEAIVRAVAASEIPVISAVGHETDTTLIDFVSDRRAPTPTAAAEMAVPVMADLRYTIDNHRQRMNKIMSDRIRFDRSTIEKLNAHLRDPMRLINDWYQKLDHLQLQAQHGLKNLLNRLAHRFTETHKDLVHPRTQIARMNDRFTNVQQQLNPAFQRRLDYLAQGLKHNGALLESFSFKKTLERGFALVTDDSGHVVTSAANARTQSKLNIRFADDTITATPDQK